MVRSIIAVSKKTWAHGRDDHQLSPMTVNGLLLGFDTVTWALGFVKNHYEISDQFALYLKAHLWDENNIEESK